MKKILLIAIVAATGLMILAGYFFYGPLTPVVSAFIDWGILLISVSGLIGIGYLLRGQILKLVRREKGAFFSVILLFAFLFTFIAGFVWSPQTEFYQNLVLNVQVPVESSFLAILAVTLLYGSLRLIRTRGWTAMSISFFASALVSLILNLGLFQVGADSSSALLIAFVRRLPLIGARGVLLGMALGGLIVGLRVLLSVDRPYGEE